MGLNYWIRLCITESNTINQCAYFLITPLELVEWSLAQFDFMHCVESDAIPLSGFKPWPPDVVLVRSQRSNHSAKLDT
jgi:hypothetical protein